MKQIVNFATVTIVKGDKVKQVEAGSDDLQDFLSAGWVLEAPTSGSDADLLNDPEFAAVLNNGGTDVATAQRLAKRQTQIRGTFSAPDGLQLGATFTVTLVAQPNGQIVQTRRSRAGDSAVFSLLGSYDLNGQTGKQRFLLPTNRTESELQIGKVLTLKVTKGERGNLVEVA